LIFTIGFVKLYLSLVQKLVPRRHHSSFIEAKHSWFAPEQFKGEEKLRQYLRPAGIGLVVIGLVLLVPPVLAGVGNLETIFGLNPFAFLVATWALMASGTILADKG